MRFDALRHRVGLALERVRRARPPRIRNLFRADHPRVAMLSYVTDPFVRPRAPRHTVELEVRCWAEALHAHGFRVDVYDYRDDRPIADVDRYDVLCGFGDPMERALAQRGSRHPVSLYYGTGCHPHVSDRASLRRKIEFARAHGGWPATGGRELGRRWPLQLMAADHYVVLGNADVAATYRAEVLTGEIHSLPAFPLALDEADAASLSGDRRRSALLWFGSAGCIHKGLPLVLEVLRALPETTLHIAGLDPVERETLGLMHLYRDCADRIVDHGFLRIGTDRCRRVLRESGVLLFPSASEGGSPAVLTAVANGAGFPIISRSCGVDLGHPAHVLDDCSVPTLVAAVAAVFRLPAAAYEERIRAAASHVRTHHTEARYAATLRGILTHVDP